MKKSAFFLIAVASSQIMASESPATCAKIDTNTARLACYDAIFRPVKPLSESAPNTPALADPMKKAVEHSKAKDSLIAAANDVSKDVASQNNTANDDNQRSEVLAEKQSVKLDKDDLFGFENKVNVITDDSIQSIAKGSYKRWKKKLKIPLENGQTWQVISSGELYFKVDNPKVTIEKGVLGSFFLGIEGVNRRLKVKRIK